jgi:four helix bundle protein
MKAEGKNDLAERTKAFALDIIEMTGNLPRTAAAQVLGKQILRSATSIGANYREASRGRSKPEFIAKVGDCLREAEEFVNCWFGCSGAVSASKSKGSAVTDRRYSGDRHERKESERFKSYTYEELTKRDKLNLDIFWLKDESLEDSANLPDPDIIAAEIVEDLEAALSQFAAIAADLKQTLERP